MYFSASPSRVEGIRTEACSTPRVRGNETANSCDFGGLAPSTIFRLVAQTGRGIALASFGDYFHYGSPALAVGKVIAEPFGYSRAMILIVAYDLHNPGRDYAAVEALLKSADGGWAHLQGSVWFVDTTATPATWHDPLKQVGDANDEYFVARIYQNWASYNMDSNVVTWLNHPNRRW